MKPSQVSEIVNSIENLLYKILEDHNIKEQHFHGGAMNRVCNRSLLDNTDSIFNDIIKLMVDTLTKRNQSQQWIKLLTSVLDDFVYLFELMDVVFSKLHILDPATLGEIRSTEKVIEELEAIWRKLQLSIPPKCHILFDYTMDQVKSHNIIADLVKDYLDHAHQAGKQLDHLVA